MMMKIYYFLFSLLGLHVLCGILLLVVAVELGAPTTAGNWRWQHEDSHLVLSLLDSLLGG